MTDGPQPRTSVGYATPASRSPSGGPPGGHRIGLFLGLCVLAGVLGILGHQAVEYARSRSGRPPACAGNLRQIAMGCIMYAAANGGRYPDSIGAAFAGTDLAATPELALCPKTADVRAPGPTTRQIEQQMDVGPPPGSGKGHVSYVYVGRGLTTASGPDHVLAFEPPTNHFGEGGQVVYADAHVEWHGVNELNRIIAAVQAGQNPPPAATQPGGR